MEVPAALPGPQPPPQAGTGPRRSSCHPHPWHRERVSWLCLPGSDGRGCQSPFLPGPAAASHHKWVWPAKKQQRNTSGAEETSSPWVSTAGDQWSGTTANCTSPRHEGSGVSSGSCIQANSALPEQWTHCSMATHGIIYTVCKLD